VGPIVGLDVVEKKKILVLPGIEPGPSIPWPCTKQTELPEFLNLTILTNLTTVMAFKGKHPAK
jgi:hypothetical protein